MANETLYSADGIIYVVTDGIGHFKVGYASCRNFPNRMIDLQVGNPFRLKVVHIRTFPSKNCRLVEETAHDLISPYRVRGEWFRASKEKIVVAVDAAVDRINAMSDEAVDEAMNSLCIALHTKKHYEKGKFTVPISEVEEVRIEHERVMASSSGRKRRASPWKL